MENTDINQDTGLWFWSGETVWSRKNLCFQIGNISQARKESISYGFFNIDVQRDSKTEYLFAQWSLLHMKRFKGGK